METQRYINSEHQKAEELMDAQKLDEALIAFNNALELNPNHPHILSQRGVLYLHLRKEKECIQDLELALSLENDYAYRYACLAFAKEHFGDIDTAIELYEKAVELEPEDAINHNNLGLLREKKGYEKQAQRDFERADELAKIQEHLFNDIDKKEAKKIDEEIKTENRYNPLPKPGTLNQQMKQYQVKSMKETPSEKESFGKVAKDIVTKKNTFKEFIGFIKNGFKLKNNDA